MKEEKMEMVLSKPIKGMPFFLAKHVYFKDFFPLDLIYYMILDQIDGIWAKVTFGPGCRYDFLNISKVTAAAAAATQRHTTVPSFKN